MHSADYIYIHVANDGSEFRPDTSWRKGRVQADGGYTVGKKGSEQRIADFDAALDLLSKMKRRAGDAPIPIVEIGGSSPARAGAASRARRSSQQTEQLKTLMARIRAREASDANADRQSTDPHNGSRENSPNPALRARHSNRTLAEVRIECAES